MIFILYAVFLFICSSGLWALYLMYVALHASMKNGKFQLLPLPVKGMSYLLLGVMGAADVAFNFFFGSMLFWEPPSTLTFSARCSKHMKENGWRGDLARWICDGWLNPFEHNHCGDS